MPKRWAWTTEKDDLCTIFKCPNRCLPGTFCKKRYKPQLYLQEGRGSFKSRSRSRNANVGGSDIRRAKTSQSQAKIIRQILKDEEKAEKQRQAIYLKDQLEKDELERAREEQQILRYALIEAKARAESKYCEKRPKPKKGTNTCVKKSQKRVHVKKYSHRDVPLSKRLSNYFYRACCRCYCYLFCAVIVAYVIIFML